MKTHNWIVVSEIFSFLSLCERELKWDLDCFESAKLCKSIYKSLFGLSKERFSFHIEQQYINNVIAKRILEKAYIDCWGFMHECKPVSKKQCEMFSQYFNFVFRHILDNCKKD